MRHFLVLLVLTAASAAFADPPTLVSAARQQTRSAVTYDGSYIRIAYPMGDVASNWIDVMKSEAEIYCPLCAWRPSATDRWVCYPTCGTEWNTFWTRGLCPGCGHQWLDTACLRCHKWSPHESWYHYPEGRDESVDDAKVEPKELETV